MNKLILYITFVALIQIQLSQSGDFKVNILQSI